MIGTRIFSFIPTITIFCIFLNPRKKKYFLSSAVCLGMGPTTTSFMPHNNSSKQQQKRPKNAQSLCPNNSFLEQGKLECAPPEGLQRGSLGWGWLLWHMFTLEQKYMDFTFPIFQILHVKSTLLTSFNYIQTGFVLNLLNQISLSRVQKTGW